MSFCVFTLCVSVSACQPYSLSPPARTLPLESSATLEDGWVSVQASGGVHDAAYEEGGNGSVSVAYAPAEGIELQLEGTYAWINYEDERSPHLGAGRVGLKLAPIEHLAVVGGLGAGAAAHGAFVSPDLGLIVAYENPYFVPWAAARGLVSLPISPDPITVTDPEGRPRTLIPPNTAGWHASTGFRIPVRMDERARLDVLGGVGLMGLYAIEGSRSPHPVLLGSLGLRLALDPDPSPPAPWAPWPRTAPADPGG